MRTSPSGCEYEKRHFQYDILRRWSARNSRLKESQVNGDNGSRLIYVVRVASFSAADSK